VMHGLPRPDIDLAFLRSEQIIERLDDLEEVENDHDVDDTTEDEDDVDIEGLDEGAIVADNYSEDSSVWDSDDSQLTEYHDRRRLREEEKEHQRRRERLRILRRSLRIEQQAFYKSIPRSVVATDSIHNNDDDDDDGKTRRHEDLDEVIRRYDERLARIDEEEKEHAQVVSRLVNRRYHSVLRIRLRQRERRVLEARARAEEARIQREPTIRPEESFISRENHRVPSPEMRSLEMAPANNNMEVRRPNVDEVWEYCSPIQLPVCRICHHCVWPDGIRRHLQTRPHRWARRDAQQMQDAIQTWPNLRRDRDHIDRWCQQPARDPIASLPPPVQGVRCDIYPDQCRYICRDETSMKVHFARRHPGSRGPCGARCHTQRELPAPPARPLWQTVFCQQLFPRGPGSLYFEVHAPVDETTPPA
ncbi:uncharacterized protein Z518_11418, partial [Rhinocladiella mackenziei CBS 650.93]